MGLRPVPRPIAPGGGWRQRQEPIAASGDTVFSEDESQKPGASRASGVNASIEGDRIRRMLEEKLAQASKEPRVEALAGVPSQAPPSRDQSRELVWPRV